MIRLVAGLTRHPFIVLAFVLVFVLGGISAGRSMVVKPVTAQQRRAQVTQLAIASKRAYVAEQKRYAWCAAHRSLCLSRGKATLAAHNAKYRRVLCRGLTGRLAYCTVPVRAR